jgi:hypothetical protein
MRMWMWLAVSLAVSSTALAQAAEAEELGTCHDRQLQADATRNKNCPACAVSAAGGAEAATRPMTGTNVASLLDPSCRNFLAYVEPARETILTEYAYVPGGALPAIGSMAAITSGMTPEFQSDAGMISGLLTPFESPYSWGNAL